MSDRANNWLNGKQKLLSVGVFIFFSATFSSYLAAEKLSVGSKSAENNWAVMQYLSSLGRDDKGKKLKGVRLKHSCIGFPCDPEEYAIKGFTFVGKVDTGDLPIQIYVVEGHELIKIAYIWTAKYESGYYVPTCEDVERVPITRSNIYPFYDKTRPSLSTESVEFITCIPDTWLSNILGE